MKPLPFDVTIALAMLAAMAAVSVLLGLPIVLPQGSSASFVGIHYVYPLAGVAVLGLAILLLGNPATGLRFMLALPCYAAVLLAHFNFKLWIPHINGASFDLVYWKADQALRPVVDGSMMIGAAITRVLPKDSNLYVTSFILMFYVSLAYHAIRTPKVFATLIVALLVFQSLGTFAYLVAPAVGPFIFERGVDPGLTATQQSMLDFYTQSVSQGPAFLAQEGSRAFVGGLAAMPSLHVGTAFLFLLFAWRHGRALVPFFVVFFAYIAVMAIASRWHYVVDLPAGLALAWVSLAIAEWIGGRR